MFMRLRKINPSRAVNSQAFMGELSVCTYLWVNNKVSRLEYGSCNVGRNQCFIKAHFQTWSTVTALRKMSTFIFPVFPKRSLMIIFYYYLFPYLKVNASVYLCTKYKVLLLGPFLLMMGWWDDAGKDNQERPFCVVFLLLFVPVFFT